MLPYYKRLFFCFNSSLYTKKPISEFIDFQESINIFHTFCYNVLKYKNEFDKQKVN